MNFTQKVLVTVVVLGIGAGGVYASRGVWRPMVEEAQRPTLPVALPYKPATSSVATTVPTSTKPKPQKPAATQPIVTPSSTQGQNPFAFKGTRPASINLAVPFLSQAPKQNWAMPYQEACEEASLLMVKNFLQARTTLSADEADTAILDLVAYETSQGDPADIPLARLSEVARQYFRLEPTMYELTSVEELKNAVANGFPVIVPAYGKALKNPNFHNGGPPYHMLVVKGYLSDGRLITNDPGTRKGADYVYDPTLFFGALHDWNGGDVPNGEKVALVLSPH